MAFNNIKFGRKFFMDYRDELQKWMKELQTDYLPSVALDLVIFGYNEGRLKVLMIRFRESDEWLLPGGRIRKEEHIDVAAFRNLRERTSLDRLFLQQFYTFGKANRLTYFLLEETLARLGIPHSEIKDYRDISVGYYALVEYGKVHPIPDFLSDECRWWNIDQLPQLLFDHNDIIRLALKTLRRNLNNQPIGYNLLPEMFTMTDLRSLYETIMGRSLDRRNFHKQMIKHNILVRLGKRPTSSSNRAPYLYRFHKEHYDQRLKNEDLSIG